MPLFLSKQLREEKKIIVELKKRIKESRTIKYDEDEEVFHKYILDDLILAFRVVPGDALLIVYDKSGKKIVSIEYESWYGTDKKPRYRWINKLFDFIKKHYAKAHQNEIKYKKFAGANRKVKIMHETKQKQEARLKATQKALEQIRGN